MTLIGANNAAAARRRAFTLIEIMVVMVIVLLLAVLVLRQVRPALEERRMREAVRAIKTMFYQAKARAIETGRPFGVMFLRDEGRKEAAVRQMIFAESPPIYAGDTEDAKAEVKEGGNCTLTGANTDLIKKGDLIRFNFQDPWYKIETAGTSIQFSSSPGTFPPKPNPDKPMNVPFQILRRPRPAIGTPIQLTGNAVVDLTQSGTGPTMTEFSDIGRELTIMFSPNGNIHGIYKNQEDAGLPPISPVHILVGKNEKVGAENLTDVMNYWISIGNQSGLVNSSPIVVEEGGGGSIKASRSEAVSMLGMGGR